MERQERLDYAAAEKSYREFRAEFRRVTRDGGAHQASAQMKRTAVGPYLKEHTEVVQAFADLDYHERGSEKIDYVRPVGHSAERLLLDVCQDSRSARTYDSKDTIVGRGEIRKIRLEVRKYQGSWKVESGDGEKAESCA